MTEIKVPQADWDLLNEKVAQHDTEITAAHKRIENLVERIMNLEHYSGLRSHSFDFPFKRQYDFNQVQSDVKLGKRPASLYQRNRQGG
jgi:hypothetical protein